MNKTHFLVAAIALLAACGMPAGEVAGDEAAIFGSDACKHTGILIRNRFDLNGSPREILVQSIDFWSLSEGRWIHEDLMNRAISPGDQQWWLGQDLQYLENDTLSRVRVNFKYRELDGDWSEATSQVIDIADVVCVEEMRFFLNVE